jgi:hypothetical protein
VKIRISTCITLLCVLSLAWSGCSRLPAVGQPPTPSAVVLEETPPTPQPQHTTEAVPAPVEMPAAPSAPLPNWDFTAQREAQGWVSVNNLAAFSFDQHGLQTQVTGGDPYMVGPRIELDPATAPHLEIHMRSTNGSGGQVFWEVDGQPFNEAASQHFTIEPDGQWHTYRLDLNGHAAWQGTITRLRLDPSNLEGADISVAWIRALGFLPSHIEAQVFGPRSAIQQENQPFLLQASLKNTGDLPAQDEQIRLELAPELALTAENARLEVSLTGLEAGKTALYSWSVYGPAGVYLADLRLGERSLRQVQVIIEAQAAGKSVQIGGDSVRLRFDRQPFGYGSAWVEWKDGSAWKLAGRLRSLGRIVYLDASDQVRETQLFASPDAQPSQTGGSLSFASVYLDADGTTWTHTTAFEPVPGKPWINIHAVLRADRPVRLLSWSGPDYLVGEGAFGLEREGGMFPGLEYLVQGEQSSGTDYAGESAARRYIPHPNKITIPFLSVSAGGMTTGMLWDPLQTPLSGHDRPAALYASPNTWDGQDNHLMRLSFPGLTAGLKENQDHLESPFLFPSGGVIKLSAALFAAPERDALAALEVWLDYSRFAQTPISAPWPLAIARVHELGLQNYTDVTWVPEQNGWHYALQDPWGPGSNPAAALHLWTSTLGQSGQRSPARLAAGDGTEQSGQRARRRSAQHLALPARTGAASGPTPAGAAAAARSTTGKRRPPARGRLVGVPRHDGHGAVRPVG